MWEKFEKKLKFKVVEKAIQDPTKKDLLKCKKITNNVYSVNEKGYTYLKKDYTLNDLLNTYNIVLDDKHLNKTPTEVWHNNIKKVLSIINETKLWEKELKTVFENLLKMTYEDHLLLQDISFFKLSENNQKELNKFYYLKKKYPFLIKKNKENACPQNFTMYIDPDYYNNLSNCILKNINLGKSSNKIAKKEFINHVTKRKSYTSPYYQPSSSNYYLYLEYDNIEHNAWLNEELKLDNIAHTYLAINENVAIYYETA